MIKCVNKKVVRIKNGKREKYLEEFKNTIVKIVLTKNNERKT